MGTVGTALKGGTSLVFLGLAAILALLTLPQLRETLNELRGRHPSIWNEGGSPFVNPPGVNLDRIGQTQEESLARFRERFLSFGQPHLLETPIVQDLISQGVDPLQLNTKILLQQAQEQYRQSQWLLDSLRYSQQRQQLTEEERRLLGGS